MCLEGFLITYKFVSKKEQVSLAKAILEAQDIIEDSWSEDDRRYSKTHSMAALEAVNIHMKEDKKFWAHIISGWNTHFWNDVQWFAVGILKEHGYNEWKGQNFIHW